MDKIPYLIIFLLIVSFAFSLIFFHFGISLIVSAFIFVFFMLFLKKGFK